MPSPRASGFCVLFAAATLCAAQPTFPNFTYFVPAVSEHGGPVYVIPGPVTAQTMIGFTVSGQACEQSENNTGINCSNAAGVITVRGDSPGSGVGKAVTKMLDIGGYTADYTLGSLVMVIEGVGAEQLFQPTQQNGLGSKNPPTTFTLPPTSLGALGFSGNMFAQNAKIRFYVADDYYPDNTFGFAINLQSTTITYNPLEGTQKLIQVNGPCDWPTWNPNPSSYVCNPTAVSASMPYVLGADLGYSFEGPDGNDEPTLFFLFGDTIGDENQPLAPPASGLNTYPDYQAYDAPAYGPTTKIASDLQLEYFPGNFTEPPEVPDQPLFYEPPSVDMHADDVPESGIYYNSQHIIVVNTGAITSLASPQTWAHSQMTDWEATNIITAGRTLSTGNSGPQPDGPATPSGHFVFISLAKLPREDALAAGLPAEGVLLVGNGQYRNESIYLAYVPKKNFIVGGKNDTNNTIQYFIGLDGKGLPTWTAPGPAGEMMATPIVIDAPNPGTIVTLPIPPGADPGTAGNTSIRYNKDLGMWLLIWDGGRIQQPWLDGMPQPPKPTQYTGIYFSEAPYAWGPWSTPQPIFVPCGNIGSTFVNPPGFGNFMRYTYKGSEGGSDDMCNNPAIANDSGPAGPIIGDPDPFDPGTTGDTAVTRRGANYAPSMVPGLTSVNGNTLTVDFNMSTWNPYATVLMQSNFTVVPPALGSVGSSPSTPTPSALQ